MIQTKERDSNIQLRVNAAKILYLGEQKYGGGNHSIVCV